MHLASRLTIQNRHIAAPLKAPQRPAFYYSTVPNRTTTMVLPSVDELRAAKFPTTVDQAGQVLREAGTPLSSPHLELLSALMSTPEGARGLFVTLLADQNVQLADKEPLDEGLVITLVYSGQGTEHARSVRDLIVKNVVMPAAMVVQYNNRNDPGRAASSQLTRDRAIRVIRAWDAVEQSSPPSFVILVRHVAIEMRNALEGNGGRFAQFVRKWGYNDQQQAAMIEALNQASGNA